MATFFEMLSIQLVLIVYVLAGVLAYRKRMITDQNRPALIKLIVEILVPALIFKSFFNITWNIIELSFQTLIIATIIYTTITLFGGFFFRDLPEKQAKILHYATLCNSAGFAGLPIVTSLFGELGAILAAVYLIPHRIFTYTIGISLLVKQEKSFKETLLSFIKNPMILAVIFGLVLGLSQIPIPSFIMNSFDGLSRTVTPLSMITIGSIIGSVKMEALFEKAVIRFVGVRMLLIPLIVLLSLKFLQVDEQIAGMCVVMATMPAGATTPILAAKYDLDVALASKLTFVSIILSLFLSPAFLAFV
ncbi:AEC family transporter [Facklamia sp. P12945]|uniref:AEC family transporter n=1 Tax=unclassified Facklamia TaxID=2622293 RepID=UPI003D16314B